MIDIRPLNRRSSRFPRLFATYVSLDVTLTPWYWDIYYYRSGRDLQARFGPLGIDVLHD